MRNALVSRAWRVVFSIVVGLGALCLLRLRADSIQRADALPAAHLGVQPASALALTNQTYTIHFPYMTRCFNTHAPLFGIQFYGTPNGSNGLTWATDAGARWIRVPLSWAAIEPANTTPQNYNWSGLDISVTNARQAGIELILTIAGQPAWAATYQQGPVTNTADLVEFVGALVERYDGDGMDDAPGSPQVRYLELYNEPDNADVRQAALGGWGYWGHNGAGYAALLQTLHPVVKAANPQTNLVFGGLALDWFDEQGGAFDSHFLDDVLAACQGQDCFDVMNFHYYPLFITFESYGPGIIGKANYVREKLAAYGFTNVPIICTETSWASATSVGWGSDELQSRHVAKAYTQGLAAGLDVVVWYEIYDRGDSIQPGLLDSTLQPKPSYWAFQVMTTMLGHASYQRPLTAAETGHAQIKGYVFHGCGRRLDVVWTEDGTPYDTYDDPSLPLTVQVQALRVVDKFGTEMRYTDGDDGVLDGQITITVGGSPLYLEYNS